MYCFIFGLFSDDGNEGYKTLFLEGFGGLARLIF
jgi:hypothetical protein